MSDIELVKTKSLIEKIKDVEQVGLLHVKGYSMREISTLMSIPVNEIKEYIEEYKLILNLLWFSVFTIFILFSFLLWFINSSHYIKHRNR